MTRLADFAAPTRREPNIIAKRLKITVLMGGPSAEREVSLKSGKAVAAALQSLGHDVYLADVAPDDLKALDRPCDLAFIALHGVWGEDGQIQRILESRGIRYCGCDPAASAIAMDKVATKRRFIEAEVPTPRFDVATPQRLEKVLESWAMPVVIKPVGEGSSVDTQIVRTLDNFHATLNRLVKLYGRCLVEQYIQGPELTVGILGGEALPPIEIRTRREFYNYEAKYIDDDTEYLFDIDLPPALLERIQELSVKAQAAVGCRDFCRVDWMVDAKTHQPYALEINTIPGFTDHSLLPKAAARVGISFPQLCQRIVELACER